MDGVIQAGDLLTPLQAMEYAIQIAHLGRGRVSPNPMVGCVIVDENHCFLSSGYHQRLGENHAEVNAIDALETEQIKGATIYVTLEPCAHEGRTPSCAKKVANLPFKKLVFGLKDPNELVNGSGIEIIRAAGIEVEEFSELKTELQELAEIFLCNQNFKRPFVAAKIASTLDGRFATHDDRSQWITGNRSREHTHFLRAGYDAILVGVNTALNDNPALNIRYPGYKDIAPKVVLIDPSVKVARANLKLFELHAAEDIFVAHQKKVQPIDERFQLLNIENMGDGLDLHELLGSLYENGIYSIFIEGGGYTISKFLNAGLVDRLHVFLAPLVMGTGKSWTDGFKPNDPLENRLVLEGFKTQVLGDDIYVTGVPKLNLR